MNKIKEITINDLNFLKELADSALGENYLNLDYFKNVISSPLYYGWTIYSYQQVPIAFLVAYKTTCLEIQEYLNDFSIGNKLSNDTICIDTMVVKPHFRKKGIGKMLVGNALSKFSKSSFIMYAWKNNEIINMSEIANLYRFTKLKEYANLWTKDCLDNQFFCPSKKNNTCVCSTVVYYLLNTREA